MADDPEKTISLVRLTEARGLLLATRGPKGLRMGRCPFAEHADENALVIDPKANTWRCTAGCGEGGVVAFVSRIEGVSASHAVELLKSDFTPTGAGAVKHSTTTKLTPVIDTDEPDPVVLDRVITFYTRTLMESPEALKWLSDRGLRDPEVIPTFRLGFCDRTLAYRIPHKNRKAGAAIRAQLERLGILRESGHEHFRGSVVVPVLDDNGHVVNVFGRKVNDNLRTGTAMEVWLTENHDAGVLNPTGFVEGSRLILAGSVLDVLAWWCAGHRNVTCSMSRETLPKAVRERIVTRKIRSVAVALRRDDDADRVFEAISRELRSIGAEVVRVVFPGGADASDVLKKGGKEALTAALKAANWVSAATAAPRPTAASPVAPGSAPEPAPTTDTDEVVLALGDRRWRVRGLSANTSHGSIRVNLLVSKGDTTTFHVDTIELYSARQRTAFVAAAATEIGVEERTLKKDLGAVLLHLEKLVDERIRATLEPNKRAAVAITDGDRDKALAFLKSPDLLDRIVADFDALGIVGERTNKLVGYLAAVSRKLANPIAVVIQSSPASGKSALLEAVLRLVPDEDRLAFSAITGRSLYYLPRDGLAHRVLAVAEEEGAGRAAYALKLLQSEGALSIASTAKDTKTGRLATHTYEVAGPVALLMTTTSLNVDEELLSRCLVLAVDEGRDHTRAIQAAQRRRLTRDALAGNAHAEHLVKLHHDAQRLLRPLRVIVPDGVEIPFADHAIRTRRDFAKVLGLVQAVALLRQHQRRVHETEGGVKYVEATDDDVAVAVRLVNEIMGPKADDLPPGTRSLLAALDGHVAAVAAARGIDRADVRFTRREVREALNLGDTRLKIHLARLVALEYVIAHASRGIAGRKVVYELVCGIVDDGRPMGGPRSPHGRPSVAAGGSDASPG